MVESSNSKNGRVFFKPGKQKEYLVTLQQKSGLAWRELAKIFKKESRTLNNWKNENCSLPLYVTKIAKDKWKIELPTNVKIKSEFWYASLGARKGGIAVFKKYGQIGSAINRRKGWYKWWKEKGQFKKTPYFIEKKINYPRKSKYLAEFVGIMLGDGGVTDKQVTVTLNSIVDKKYSVFVYKFMTKLFGVIPAKTKRPNMNAVTIVISRVKLVKFCQSIGLILGDKLAHGLDIPKWIYKKRIYKIHCIRGLMDTDGCIFSENHRINGKMYCYPKLALVSHSEKLRSSVFETLCSLGFSPFIRNNRSVQIEDIEQVRKYFNIIGSDNPKHIERYKKFTGRGRIMVIPPVLKTGAP